MTAAETSERGGACALLGACAAEDDRVDDAGAVAARAVALTDRRARRPGRRRPRTSHGGDRRLDRARPSAPQRPLPRLPVVPAGAGVDRATRRCDASSTRCPARSAAWRCSSSGASSPPSPCSPGRPRSRTPRRSCAAISLRGIPLDEPLDTIVVPLPWLSLHEPREPLNPITAAATGLGHAMRLWRDASPLREDGTIVLLHDLRRTFGHGPQAPYSQPVPRAPRGRGRGRPRGRPSLARQATRARSARTARATHPIRCSRTSTGRRAPPRSSAPAGCSSAAAATRAPPARSASSRPTASRRRSRWRAASPAAATAPACCWRRRTRRWSVGDGVSRPTTPDDGPYPSPRYVLRTCSLTRSSAAGPSSATRPVSST